MDTETNHPADGAPAFPEASPEYVPQAMPTAVVTESQIVSLVELAPFSAPNVNIPAVANQGSTDPASYPAPETSPAQHQSDLQEHDHSSADEPGNPDLLPKLDTGGSQPETHPQEEPATRAIAMPSCSTARFPPTHTRLCPKLASLPSPEPVPVPKQGVTSSPKDSIPDGHCGSWRDGSAETIVAPVPQSPSSTASSLAIADSAAIISGVTDLEQNKDGTLVDKRDAIANSHHGAQEPPRTTPRPAPPTARRSRTARSFVVSAGRRGLHFPRAPARGADRELQNFMARVHPEALPLQIPRVHTRRDEALPGAPNLSRAFYRPKAGKDGPQNSRAARVPQAPMAANMPAGLAAAHGRIPIHDMEGVPHVLGGLVEASVGRKDLLFAKEVKGDLSDCYNTLKVARHQFFAYPPPDMFEHNREFDRELEEARPTFYGFDTEVIDRQVDYYGGGSEYFAKLMEEHQAEFDPVYESFTSIKAQLTSLNYDRERIITSQYAEKPAMTPQACRKRLAEIAVAEEPLLEDINSVRPELTEIVFRGRVKIAHALKQDLRAPNVIDEKRFRACQRTILEEREREIGVAGSMIGLRGTPKQQSLENYTTIMRCAQIHVDEVLAEFDEPEKLHRVGKPTKLGGPRPPSRESYRDAVITTIPLWFTILDAKGTVKLYGDTPLDRFRELTQSMGNSYAVAREERRNDESRPNKDLWPKQFHEPHGAWPNANQRERGGWWACRSGPDASRAERDCQLCHAEEPVPSAGRRAAAIHQHITDEIEKAMAEANKRDRLMLKYQLQQEREDVDRYWQRREFTRSGGGANISEVMFRRGVNELNYRPLAGRSQSWQPQGSAAQSQDLAGMSAGVVNKPRQMERAQTWPQPGPQTEAWETLRGKQADDKNGPSKTVSQPPGDKLVAFPRFELLCGQTVEMNLGPQTGSSQASQRLAGEHISDVNSPQAGPSQTLQRPAGSRAHPLLSGRQANGNTPPKVTDLSPPSQLLLDRSPPLQPQLSDIHVHGSTSPRAASSQGLGRSPPLQPPLSDIHVHGSTSPPAPSTQGLGRSPPLLPQLSDIHANGRTSPPTPGPSQLPQRPAGSRTHPLLSGMCTPNKTTSLRVSVPPQTPYRPTGSRTHPLLSSMYTPNKTVSPPAGGPSHPPQHPVRSQTHPLPSETYTPNKAVSLATARPPYLPQHAEHPTVSPQTQGQVHPLLSGKTTPTTTTNNKQTAPPQSQLLHRHNSSQVHDVLHGRNETAPATGSGSGPAQLRSALARPGSGRKGVGGKRVSWQY